MLLDTASTSHTIKERSFFVTFTEDMTNMQSVHGVTPDLVSRIAGVGTVAVVTKVEDEQVVLYIDDVYYVPGAEFGLFSPEFARNQGFDVCSGAATMSFIVSHDIWRVIIAKQHDSTGGFQVTHLSGSARAVKSKDGSTDDPTNGAVCNYTVAEGVGSLPLWYERLCHTCPQYLKTMIDKGLVQGMMLTARQQSVCDACHMGKQKRQERWKQIDRRLKKPNQVVYANLLIPNKHNGTRYEAVLIIMDGYSRFVTIHLLKSKVEHSG